MTRTRIAQLAITVLAAGAHVPHPVLADSGSPGLTIASGLPGTSVTFKPYLEVEGGYDSNPDSLMRRQASRFEKLEAGLAVAAKRPTELYELGFKARGVDFDQLDINNRWDLKTNLDLTFDLTPRQQLKIGSSYLRDFFALNRSEIVRSYIDYNLRADDFRLRLQGKSQVELNIERNEGLLAPLPSDTFDTVRGRAFDYSKSEGQIALIGWTKAWLQPFVIYNYANIDYFHQAADPIVDRNATEQFGIAGVRVDLGAKFRIDVGGRVNQRDFDDTTIRHFSSQFYDVNFVWTPTATFKVKGVIERVIKEPSTSFGLADDMRSYGVTVDWQATQKLRFVVSSYYDRVTPIGDDFIFNKYSVTGNAVYALSEKLDFFVSGLAKWVDDEISGQSYTRFKLGSGIKMKF